MLRTCVPSFHLSIHILIISIQALHLNPQDKAVLYNIAMIMQKAAEMMFALPPAKRQVKDLQRAIGQGSQAQK